MLATLSTGWAQGSMATLATLAPAPYTQQLPAPFGQQLPAPYTPSTASPSTPSKATSVPLAGPPIDVQAAFEERAAVEVPAVLSFSLPETRIVVKEEPASPGLHFGMNGRPTLLAPQHTMVFRKQGYGHTGSYFRSGVKLDPTAAALAAAADLAAAQQARREATEDLAEATAAASLRRAQQQQARAAASAALLRDHQQEFAGTMVGDGGCSDFSDEENDDWLLQGPPPTAAPSVRAPPKPPPPPKPRTPVNSCSACRGSHKAHTCGVRGLAAMGLKSEGGRGRKRVRGGPSREAAAGGEEEFIIERILSQTEVDDATFYLIQWKGYDASYNSWEPEANLAHISAEWIEAQLSMNEDANDAAHTAAGAPKKKKKRRKPKEKEEEVDDDDAPPSEELVEYLAERMPRWRAHAARLRRAREGGRVVPEWTDAGARLEQEIRRERAAWAAAAAPAASCCMRPPPPPKRKKAKEEDDDDGSGSEEESESEEDICGNMMDFQGGHYGCVLPFGHDGPHQTAIDQGGKRERLPSGWRERQVDGRRFFVNTTTGEEFDTVAEVRSALSNRAITPLIGGSAPTAQQELLMTARMLQRSAPRLEGAAGRRALFTHQRDLGLRPSD